MNSTLSPKDIVKEIIANKEVESIVFVGCGASKADWNGNSQSSFSIGAR